ncbi:hypothetical protein BDP27DRAFT_32822 [Rhodocollybia butyracea]|uniref:Uncharacterized protein n=1 Tax=Rhodocollybia butyracea TaxID=206335 RepID=A0A9P5UDE5_9AGAR|nr:hypothetical protein BDP27DRAFT_32822 [Rhodocollybia butyracea]
MKRANQRPDFVFVSSTGSVPGLYITLNTAITQLRLSISSYLTSLCLAALSKPFSPQAFKDFPPQVPRFHRGIARDVPHGYRFRPPTFSSRRHIVPPRRRILSHYFLVFHPLYPWLKVGPVLVICAGMYLVEYPPINSLEIESQIAKSVI